MVACARGLGAARNSDSAGARKEIERLGAIRAEIAGASGYDWASQTEVQRRTVEAWLAHAEGRRDEALTGMRAAADLEDKLDKHPVTPGAVLPARELLGELLLAMNRPGEALREFESTLRESPNRFNALYAAARAARLSAQKEKAASYYSKLITVCSGADSARPGLQEAREFTRR
jgi:tetratricopeptide (TPR) repeat protein